MIHLTARQFEQFEVEARRRLDAGIADRVAAHWPEHFVGPSSEGARWAVRGALEAARRHGIDTEFDLSRFAHLSFLVGDARFHEAPWALALLNQVPVRGARAVMNELVATARQRAAVADRADHG